MQSDRPCITLRLSTSRRHIILQDDGGTDFIDNGLVLPGLFAQSPVNHSAMGQYGGEALIIIFDGHRGYGLTPASHKLPHPLQILAGLAIGLAGLTDNDALHRFAGNITLEIGHQFRCRYSGQPSRYNLQGVGHCQSCTLLTVIYRQYPRHDYLPLKRSHASGYLARNSLRLAAASALLSKVAATTRYMLRSVFFTIWAS